MNTSSPEGGRGVKLGRFQRLIHALLIAIGWVLFFGFWWRVLFQQQRDFAVVALLIVAVAILTPLVTLYWVTHNVGIFRKKGPRKANRSMQYAYARDWSGKPVSADWEIIRVAPRIVVDADEDGKYYLIEKANPAQPESRPR